MLSSTDEQRHGRVSATTSVSGGVEGGHLSMHSRGNIVQDHESLNKNSGELVAEEEVQYVEEEYYIEEEVEESVEESAEQQSV